ncbi:LPS biosynthesis protein [Pseudoalteromonas sp. A25]|uniref:glycosyltransferase family 2 protein n=1 Tax=Pseudoalteromonas sp. A25 TaxID=116092 RepID=UPI0012A0AEC1|nr:glycosyltransferase family 2 protein [Pseudoalteromonas sp. A25]BBN82898.1 LPS biosynthesis protein [Pseudoalteromonas sp. A25]
MNTRNKTTPIPVSVFIVTLNEQRYIAQVLESIKSFAEIIVVDSGSSDETVSIAEHFGAKVYHQDWLGFAKQKQFALEKCSYDWVLNLDADEVLTDACIDEIIKQIELDKYSAVRFQRDDIFIYKKPSLLARKDNNVRFYKRNNAKFNVNQQVHESAKIEGPELKSTASFVHHGYNEVATLVLKTNDYSTLKAQDKFASNKRSSLVKLLLVFPVTFIKEFFIRRKIFSGRRGFILSMINAQYAFLKEAKLFELHEKAKHQQN